MNTRIEGTIDSVVEEAVGFCRRNMKIRTIIDPSTGARSGRTEYPAEAIREAILNALIHRDYSHPQSHEEIRLTGAEIREPA